MLMSRNVLFCEWMGKLSKTTVSKDSHTCYWDVIGLLDIMGVMPGTSRAARVTVCLDRTPTLKLLSQLQIQKLISFGICHSKGSLM